MQGEWDLEQEITDEERTNNGEIICEVATSATTTQSDRDILLDQLAQLLSVSGADDIFAKLPQNCKELVNNAALVADDSDSESDRMLMELSGGEPSLNVTSIKTLRTGQRRQQAARQSGRLLKQQHDLSSVLDKISAGSMGWETGGNRTNFLYQFC